MADEQGFTLVEVLVALVVTSILLAILMSAATTARARSHAVEERQEAMLLAQALLDEVSGDTARPPTSTGRIGRFSWTVERVQIASEPRHFVGLFAWRVSVFGRKKHRLISVSTRRLIEMPAT